MAVPTPLDTDLPEEARGLFCKRMAALRQAEPWRRMSEAEMVSVEGLTPDPIFLSILGQRAPSMGLCVFLTESAAATMQRVPGAALHSLPCLIASFESEDVLEASWPAEIRERGWDLAGEDEFPVVARLGSITGIPSAQEMRLLSDLVQIVADCPFEKDRPGHLEFHLEGRDGIAVWPALASRASERVKPGPA